MEDILNILVDTHDVMRYRQVMKKNTGKMLTERPNVQIRILGPKGTELRIFRFFSLKIFLQLEIAEIRESIA